MNKDDLKKGIKSHLKKMRKEMIKQNRKKRRLNKKNRIKIINRVWKKLMQFREVDREGNIRSSISSGFFNENQRDLFVVKRFFLIKGFFVHIHFNSKYLYISTEREI